MDDKIKTSLILKYSSLNKAYAAYWSGSTGMNIDNEEYQALEENFTNEKTMLESFRAVFTEKLKK